MNQLLDLEPARRATDPLWIEIRDKAISLAGWYRRKYSLPLNHPSFLEATETIILEDYLQNEAFEEHVHPELLDRKRLEKWEEEMAESTEELKRWKDKWSGLLKKKTPGVSPEKNSLYERLQAMKERMTEEEPKRKPLKLTIDKEKKECITMAEILFENDDRSA